MNWLCECLTSSIGKKIQVALAGLFLCTFLIVHLGGNLLLGAGPQIFNLYADTLEARKSLLAVAEIGLLALFLLHIIVALWVRWQNWQARPIGYTTTAWAGGRTLSSASALYTGLIVAVFLVVHVRAMRFEERAGTLYDHVLHELSGTPAAVFYLVCLGALGVHLSHGVQAAAKTLGGDHPKFTPVIENAGLAFAIVITGAFAVIAVWGGWFAGGRP